MNKNLLKSVIFALLAFALSLGTGYGLTYYLYSPQSNAGKGSVTPAPEGGKLTIDPTTPKTAECPVNGKMYTATEQKIWESRRPLVVMIENSPDSRPQSGLNSADVLYEAVAEGGVTRFAAVMYCDIAKADTIVGPVRSARTHFVSLASEYNLPLYVHVGGSNCSSADGGKTCTTDKRVQALEQLSSFNWTAANDLNQFSIGFPTFWRDYERLGRTVATEHTMYSSTEKLYRYAKASRNWTNLTPKGEDWKKKFVAWGYKDEAKEGDRGTVSKISFGFWESYHQFDVVWNYDATSNAYKRENGGAAHPDLNDNSQLETKSVVVQYTKETGPLDEHKHMWYDVIGTGDALVFQDGKVIKATWSKKDRESRTVYTDEKGKKISFNRGRIFVEIIPKDNKVEY